MARALDQIINELNSTYNPRRDNFTSQIGALDPQMQAEEQGLEATKQDSFKQIERGANRRGMFYSGVPIQEQAQYTGGQFLPAVANLRSRYSQQRFNLRDSIAKINEEQQQYGQGIWEREKAQDYKAEQDRLARDDQLRRDAEARSAASRGGFGGFSGGGGDGGGGRVQGAQTDPTQQAAYNDVFSRIQGQNDAALRSDYAATKKSAAFGNTRDKIKLQIYAQLRPDLFRGVPASAVGKFASY